MFVWSRYQKHEQCVIVCNVHLYQSLTFTECSFIHSSCHTYVKKQVGIKFASTRDKERVPVSSPCCRQSILPPSSRAYCIQTTAHIKVTKYSRGRSDFDVCRRNRGRLFSLHTHNVCAISVLVSKHYFRYWYRRYRPIPSTRCQYRSHPSNCHMASHVYSICLHIYTVSQKNCTPKAGWHKFIEISSPIMIFHTSHRHSFADRLSS